MRFPVNHAAIFFVSVACASPAFAFSPVVEEAGAVSDKVVQQAQDLSQIVTEEKIVELGQEALSDKKKAVSEKAEKSADKLIQDAVNDENKLQAVEADIKTKHEEIENQSQKHAQKPGELMAGEDIAQSAAQIVDEPKEEGLIKKFMSFFQ